MSKTKKNFNFIVQSVDTTFEENPMLDPKCISNGDENVFE